MVELTLAGVMMLLKRAPSWEESKKALSDASFMDKLLHYDRDHMDDLLLKRISKLTSNPDFAPEVGIHIYCASSDSLLTCQRPSRRGPYLCSTLLATNCCHLSFSCPCRTPFTKHIVLTDVSGHQVKSDMPQYGQETVPCSRFA